MQQQLGAAPRVGPVRRVRESLWTHRWGYIMVLPSFILFFVFFLVPVLASVYISFLEYLPFSVKWVGLENYTDVFADPIFRKALTNNAIYTAAVVALWLGKSLLIAYLFDPLSSRLQTIFKSAFYLPGISAGVIISLVWLWIYNPAFGLANAIMQMVGLDPVAWLGNTSTALPALIFMELVMGGGSTIVLIAAAMSRVPAELYESALLDGAPRWKIFTRITVPLIRPVLLYLVVMGTINTFQVFENVYVMTGGGPQFATTTLVYEIYQTAFVDFRMGEASAQSMVLFAILFVLAAIQFKWLGSEVEY